MIVTELAEASVAYVLGGSSDAESCPAGTKAIAYQSPARLYCPES